ncbi:zinc ribbon domain-containing protein [Aminipila luticellarii]|mgnify:CR=1 FL=1|uniref:Zinc ribbon domain-containing protein n=1 Tax=Aminipila luticellarii TaxID=2507160 RepID=A0A410PSE0_9FIRM|nr:zinc ribbon domain-containing protein [Aminipila luticellarii]QAT41809.1 zinc ribbon domain-containing protein [Aminipila luticellarii]
MKSIKPGRGPSMMSGLSSVFVGIFGVIWTIGAAGMGAPAFFSLFGIVFVGIAIVQAVYNFNNATSKDRFSEFDIVDETEESDPLQELVHKKTDTGSMPEKETSLDFEVSAFCPYCGAKLGEGFQFCSKCGKKMPE